jgi:hypothetical protein
MRIDLVMRNIVAVLVRLCENRITIKEAGQ